MARQKRHRRVLVWMRRAARVHDNAALWHAVQDAEDVVPILVLDRSPHYSRPTLRRRFVRETIRQLDLELRRHNSALHIRMGRPERELPAAARAYGADAVYAVRLYDPPALARDSRVEQALNGVGVGLVLWKDRVLREKDEILTGAGTPYRVYTPYKNAWLASAEETDRPYSTPRIGGVVDPADGSLEIDALRWGAETTIEAGERHALNRLALFLKDGMRRYAADRDMPGVDGTSRLSAHLAIGTLSIRTVYWRLREALDAVDRAARAGGETYLRELLWREFYYQILSHYPHALDRAFREEYAGIRWRNAPRLWNAWTDGATGYPIVDAAMRQLQAEGWMHNRARMIVASFLTKDLHLNWQSGERFFSEQLLDADHANNNGGWQWTAGTGTDASPWFRIFNPVLQGKKFDPDGVYVRRYLPELRAVPDRFVHAPWTMNRQDQEAYGCRIGREYPRPIVDHTAQRATTFALYNKK